MVSDGLALDGTVAESTAQARELWGLRERITEALVRAGAVYKYDVSLPTHRMYELVRDMRERLRGTGAVTVGYGHVGDGNLHLNVSTTRPDERVLGAMMQMMLPLCLRALRTAPLRCCVLCETRASAK